ncbi:CPBP family intramembrane metalloprotease [Candidatus Saccharibacteria bacterium]|nr:CPBP family intramembrane metalloprotease [Candidatus Saccharibacteria bacterium]
MLNPAVLLRDWNKNQFEASQINLKNRLIIILRLAIFCLSIATILIYLGGILQTLAGYQGQHAIESFFEDNSLVLVMFFVVIVAPVSEELIFRLPLDGKLGSLILGVLTALALISGLLLPAIILAIPVLILIAKRRLDYGLRFSRSQQFWLVIFSAIGFGFFHGYNFENLDQYWWLWPVLVSPQLIYGYILGIVRLRFGFFYSIGLHALINLFASLPVILLQNNDLNTFDTGSNYWSGAVLIIGLVIWGYSVWNFFNIVLRLRENKFKQSGG